MKLPFSSAIFLLIVLQGCAKIGTPTGGPKDVAPPEYIGGVPENRAVKFDGDRIDIFFNEYLQLKDQNKEILISPPMDKKPVVRIREKSVRVTFSEDLLPNTTYTLNFGKSITDLNEGNALPDFEFVLSTGEYIDSLSVTGRIRDAFTLKPEEKNAVFVLLYENLSDSAPYKEIPRYYGKANSFGIFAVNNIHPDTFRIIALEDANNNLRYDQGLEDIAFMDSLLIINSENVTVQTFIKDTLKIITPERVVMRGNRRDTANTADTIIAPGKVLNALNISMNTFSEENNQVYVTSRNRESPEKFTFTFSRPLFDTINIVPLNFTADNGWFLTESSAHGDTLSFWITDSLISKKDTLSLKISFTTTDSSGLFVTKTDTVKLRLSAPRDERGSGGGRRARQELKKPAKNLQLIPGIRNDGMINLNAVFALTANRPVKSINPANIELNRIEDTLFFPVKFEVTQDTLRHNKFAIETEWEESAEYKVLLKPGSVTDIYENTNDSLQIRFMAQREDFYGRILLNFSAYAYPMIVQILDQKGAVVRSAIAGKAGIIEFTFMVPGSYSFKAIYDRNGNGRWDTGNYLKKIQPEKVYISEKPEQLRSNWDWEPSWNILE